MQFSTVFPISLLVTLGLAQSTTLSAAALPTSSTCAAQEVFNACLATGQGYASSCSASDYGCLCQKWGDILTCYLQCPNDSGYASALASKTTYCNNASIYTSSTSSAVSVAVSSSPSSAATGASGASATATGGAVRTSGSGTSSAATASSTSKSGAEKMVVGAGGLVMGFIAAIL